MALNAIRPPWLPSEKKLNCVLQEHSPRLNLKPSDLCADRNAKCPLVGQVLDLIVNELENRPTEFEIKMAKIHLAVDVQKLFMSWCQIGLQKTMTGSDLKPFFYPGVDTNCRNSATHETRFMDLQVGSHAPDIQRRTKPERRASHDSIGNLPPIQCSTTAIPAKRQFKGEELSPRSNKISRTGERLLQCPFYKMDPQTEGHSECMENVFPNPRKLKEHVWKTTRPFRCPTCGEGFGREKTKAIHCEQKKVKCKPKNSSYEGSAEQRRDQKIEAAKSTQEVQSILEEFNATRENLITQQSLPPLELDISLGTSIGEDADNYYSLSPRSPKTATYSHHDQVSSSRLPSPPEEGPESKPCTAGRRTSDAGLNPSMLENNGRRRSLTPHQQVQAPTELETAVARFQHPDYNENRIYTQDLDLTNTYHLTYGNDIPKIVITPEPNQEPTVFGTNHKRRYSAPGPPLPVKNTYPLAFSSCPTSPIDQPFFESPSYYQQPPTQTIIDETTLNISNSTFPAHIRNTNYDSQGLDIEMSQPSRIGVTTLGYRTFPAAEFSMKFSPTTGQWA
ncbi:hypothetical protein RUND412_001825 [Rhizina undulata]